MSNYDYDLCEFSNNEGISSFNNKLNDKLPIKASNELLVNKPIRSKERVKTTVFRQENSKSIASS